MVKGKRIGIAYTYDENWVGGTYYVQNLISALHHLPDEKQHLLYVLTKDKKTFNILKEATHYHKLIFLKDSVSEIQNIINKIALRIIKKRVFCKVIKLDFLFPLSYVPQNFDKVSNVIFWIPDLQEKYLPHFFSDQEIDLRNNRYRQMILLNKPIVFSSYAAKRDFEIAFPKSLNKKIVIQFAVTHPKVDFSTIDSIKKKYNISNNYFITPNQFWQHKNHLTLIKGVKLLKESGVQVHVVFTGKEYDYRCPNYTTDLKNKVKEFGLENEIHFLGFISRHEQLVLMKYAIAIVQPSLFEGWSTVVEDAKALNQTVIVSNIDVHKEQIGDKGYFFDPDNISELANVMQSVLQNDVKLKYDIDYKSNVANFAAQINDLILGNL